MTSTPPSRSPMVLSLPLSVRHRSASLDALPQETGIALGGRELSRDIISPQSATPVQRATHLMPGVLPEKGRQRSRSLIDFMNKKFDNANLQDRFDNTVYRVKGLATRQQNALKKGLVPAFDVLLNTFDGLSTPRSQEPSSPVSAGSVNSGQDNISLRNNRRHSFSTLGEVRRQETHRTTSTTASNAFGEMRNVLEGFTSLSRRETRNTASTTASSTFGQMNDVVNSVLGRVCRPGR